MTPDQGEQAHADQQGSDDDPVDEGPPGTPGPRSDLGQRRHQMTEAGSLPILPVAPDEDQARRADQGGPAQGGQVACAQGRTDHQHDHQHGHEGHGQDQSPPVGEGSAGYGVRPVVSWHQEPAHHVGGHANPAGQAEDHQGHPDEGHVNAQPG